MVYSLLEGPFIFYSKPIYYYEKNSVATYVASTRYIDNFYGFFVTLFGFFIALSRMRDKLIRTKLWNIWHQITCRRGKMVRWNEFERLVEKS